MTHLTYAEAIVVGLIQGVTELFPVSSLGHNVLLPAIIGGSWAKDLDVSKSESPYLAFIVGLHVATAIGLTAYFWRDWVRIIGGFFSSLRRMEIETTDQKLAWMIIFATIPVGLTGVIFEHEFRVIFGVPSRAAIFLFVNGIILFCAERFRTRKSKEADAQIAADREREPELVGAGGPPIAQHASGQRALRQEENATAIAADRRLSRLRLRRRPSSSARPRSSRCSPESAGTGSRWPPACSAACPGRTPPGSPSCWRLR